MLWAGHARVGSTLPACSTALARFLARQGRRCRHMPLRGSPPQPCRTRTSTNRATPAWRAARSELGAACIVRAGSVCAISICSTLHSGCSGSGATFARAAAGPCSARFQTPGCAPLILQCCRGRSASQKYNHDIRRHTLQVAILGQLQRPPAGFEEAVRCGALELLHHIQTSHAWLAFAVSCAACWWRVGAGH